jgi:glycosyltransferase involved in cell wall biosynthesis
LRSADTIIVVPCYNEARRLRPAAFDQLLQDASLAVIFVDDGSTDGTTELILRHFAGHEGVDVLTLAENVGKGEAVRRGLLDAIERGASIVAYLDADLASPLSELTRLLQRLDARADVAVALGSRVRLLGHHIDRSASRHFQGRIFATAASLILGLSVYDTQCGLKAFRVTDALVDALSRPFKSRWVFDVELLGRLVSGPHQLRPDEFVEIPLLEWQDIGGSNLSMRSRARSLVDLVFVVGPELRSLRAS